MLRRKQELLFLLVLCTLCVVIPSAAEEYIAVQLLSVSATGAGGSGASANPAISSDGRYVVFESQAADLVAGDTNGQADIFLHDRLTGLTERVNISLDGSQANAPSTQPTVSDDGRYVAYTSHASNLFYDDTNNQTDVFVRDRVLATNIRVTGGSGASGAAHISGQGRWVVFESTAGDLVAGDLNGVSDVFVYDILTRTTVRLSVSAAGQEGDNASTDVSVSADGRYVLFASLASNLVPGDTNGFSDIFLRDRLANTVTRVSVSTGGTQVFADNLRPVLSANGNYLAFVSLSNQLVPDDSNGTYDTFWRSRTDLTSMTRVSVSSQGLQSSGSTEGRPAISGDGLTVFFTSTASDLISGDTNGAADVFAHATGNSRTNLVSQNRSGDIGSAESTSPAASSDGYFVVFTSAAVNLTPEDTAPEPDVLLATQLDYDLVENGGFELPGDTANLAEGWLLTAPSGDKRVCTVAHQGACSFMFRGRSGESVVLAQQFTTRLDRILPGDRLSVRAHVRRDTVAGQARIQVKLRYVDPTAGTTGTGQDKARIVIPRDSTAPDFLPLTSNTVMIDGAVLSAKIQISYTGTAGKFYVDRVEVTLNSGSTREAAAQNADAWQPVPQPWLPPPPNPGSARSIR